MKGFIPLGNNSFINPAYIDLNRSHYDSRLDRVVLFDIYGTRFFISKACLKNKKISINGLK